MFALFDEVKKLWNSYWNFTRNNNIHVNTLKYTVIEIFYQTTVSSKGCSTICQNVILEIFFTGSAKLFHKQNAVHFLSKFKIFQIFFPIVNCFNPAKNSGIESGLFRLQEKGVDISLFDFLRSVLKKANLVKEQINCLNKIVKLSK